MKEEMKIVKDAISSYIESGELQKAEMLVNELSHITGDNDEIFSIRSVIAFVKGDYEACINYVQLGLKINITNPELYYNMGKALEAKGELTCALLCYKQSLYYCKEDSLQNFIMQSINELHDIKVAGTSIIILTYNNIEYTKLCIQSIRGFVDTNDCEVIVVDNNSNDGTKEWLNDQKDLKCIFNSENKGFPAGCNQGILKARKGNDIFLLNNDTILMPNSLFNLKMALYKSDKIGAAGAVSNSVGYYQQISDKFNTFDEYIEYAKENNIPTFDEDENRVKLIGFAMLIKRECIDKVGLLDERFTPGNFEDDDICLRILKKGYQLKLVKESFIFHFGSMSFSKDSNKYSRLLSDNYRKFNEKWGDCYQNNIKINVDLIRKIDFTKIDKSKKCRVLHIGCGIGATLFKIKGCIRDVELYGYDELDEAREILKSIDNINMVDLEWIKNNYLDLDIILINNELKDKINFISNNNVNQIIIEDAKYYIHPSCDVRNIHKMNINEGVVIQEGCWLNVAKINEFDYNIEIGEGCNIGRRSIISSANKVILGEKVLLGPNVYISDCGHEYSDINIPIMDQGIDNVTNTIEIGKGTWIGINCAVIGNVKIGKNCVIGANSVVNKNIPDYCVAVGSPVRVVKAYDIVRGEWVKVQNEDELNEILKKREGKKYIKDINDLKSLQVEVSSVCNLKCPQCFNNIKGHKSAIISDKIWNEKIRPVLKGLKDIHLVGIGEPLLCKNIFKYIEECAGLGITVHTTSNLQLVDDEIAKKIVLSGLKFLSFSCDGSTEETYQKIRINGTLKKLKDSVNMINFYKKKYKSEFPKLILNFGAINSNIDELVDIVYMAKEMKVEQIISYHDVIYVKELEEESLYYNQEKSDYVFKEAAKIAKECGVKYFYPGTFENSINYKHSKGKVYCPYPYNHLWIYSDGRVGPCCMDFPNRIVFGDLNKSNIEEVWNGEEIVQLRKDMENNPPETCLYCLSHGKMDIKDKKYLIKV